MKRKKILAVITAVLLFSLTITAIPIQAAVNKGDENEALSYDFDKNKQKDWIKLNNLADQYGINIEGLSLVEGQEKIKIVLSYLGDNSEQNDSLQQQADAMGISITGMTNDEAQAYILKVDQERRDAADAERNLKEDAAREQAARDAETQRTDTNASN